MSPTSRQHRADDGFTLIELLIAIVILGILAAVVVLATGGATSSADDAACAADRRTVMTAVEAYVAETGNPATMNALVSADWLETASVNYDVDGTAFATGRC